jgi:predicted enzyme related to lactoylglutathione lyase
MKINAKLVHTNIVAEDWRRLARFYTDVLGCTPVPPERDLSGEWIDRGTGIPGVQIRGAHLRFPGFGDDGPTLEIFQYDPQEARASAAVNRPGFTHIAFAVDDVGSATEAILAAGGRAVGDIVTHEIRGAGTLTFVYVTDPEGNILELQAWAR